MSIAHMSAVLINKCSMIEKVPGDEVGQAGTKRARSGRARMTEDQIALQLYTVRDLTAQDMAGTLRRLAEIGYKAVQLAGYGNSSPEEIRRVLDECGMRASSAHVDLQRWEDPEAVFEELETLGCSHAVVPFLP